MAYLNEYGKVQMEVETLRAELRAKEAELERLKTKPAEPRPGTWFTVEVMFRDNPIWYRFLVMHVRGKGYYTTGTIFANAFFASWDALWEYFDGPDVKHRSAMRVIDYVGLPPIAGQRDRD